MTSKKLSKEKYYRKQIDLFPLVQKIKLWPSRSGTLHGVKSFKIRGAWGEVTTHCNQKIFVRNSRRSRAARWLRNKWFFRTCKKCGVPGWKLEKFSFTFFSRHRGSQLR